MFFHEVIIYVLLLNLSASLSLLKVSLLKCRVVVVVIRSSYQRVVLLSRSLEEEEEEEAHYKMCRVCKRKKEGERKQR